MGTRRITRCSKQEHINFYLNNNSHFKITTILLFLTIRIQAWGVPSPVLNNPNNNVGTYAYDISTDLRICADDDTNSKLYCQCKDEVVSCDFSKFPNPSNSKQTTHMSLIGSWNQDQVKRVCICGAPSNLQVEIKSKFLEAHPSVNRVDIYKMDGPINVPFDFKIHFSGDIYIARVKSLKKMAAWAFGRGLTINMTDTEGLQCCSNITTPKLASPVFFMEDTTVGLVEDGGITSDHLWNSIVFNRVAFQEMRSYGIRLDNTNQLNASFTNCLFQNLEKNAIVVNDVVNLLIAHSKFEDTCDPLAVGARAVGDTSTVALIGNKFMGPHLLNVDGKVVVVWHNKFAVWDNSTFSRMAFTKYTERKRVVSIEFNAIDKSLLLDVSVPEIGNDDTLIINENVISECECTIVTNLQLPPAFSNWTNRCDTRERFPHCHLSLYTMLSECKKSSSPDLGKLCNKEKGSVPNSVILTLPQVEGKIKAPNIHVDSVFLNDMLKYVRNPFRTQEFKSGKRQAYKTSKGSSERISPKTMLTTLITFTMCLYLLQE